MLACVFSSSKAEFMHHILEAVNKESLGMKTVCAFILDLFSNKSVNEQQTLRTNPLGVAERYGLIMYYYSILNWVPFLHELKLLKKQLGELKIAAVCSQLHKMTYRVRSSSKMLVIITHHTVN